MEAQEQTTEIVRRPCRQRIIRHFARKLSLRQYILEMTPEEITDFSKCAGTTYATLQQIYGGWEQCSAMVARRIEDASNGAIPTWNLRADIFDKPADAKRMK
jgi:hypothetical protein